MVAFEELVEVVDVADSDKCGDVGYGPVGVAKQLGGLFQARLL